VLQQSTLSRHLIDAFEDRPEFPPAWKTMAQLEATADAWVARLHAEKQQTAAGQGGLARLRERLDSLIRTDRTEYLDRDDVSDADKVREIHALHQINRILMNYHRFAAVLAPHIRGVAKDAGRPARILELASGSGEFTLALAERAKQQGLPAAVTGSDIVEAYVDRANARAARRGLDVDFRVINAFDMSNVDAGAYDLVFIAQSVHHFSPGQLAMIVAQSHRIATRGFIAVDGQRSLFVLGMTGLMGLTGSLMSRRHHMLHDALVSGCRFYSEGELELIARIAAPSATVSVGTSFPSYTVLRVS